MRIKVTGYLELHDADPFCDQETGLTESGVNYYTGWFSHLQDIKFEKDS